MEWFIRNNYEFFKNRKSSHWTYCRFLIGTMTSRTIIDASENIQCKEKIVSIMKGHQESESLVFDALITCVEKRMSFLINEKKTVIKILKDRKIKHKDNKRSIILEKNGIKCKLIFDEKDNLQDFDLEEKC